MSREKLIELYGEECFIEKLHLRIDIEPRRYKRKLKKLTYHHIEERCKGGKATVENGALLSIENHRWFNEQSPEVQRLLNEIFQAYKSHMPIEDLKRKIIAILLKENRDLKKEKRERREKKAKRKAEKRELKTKRKAKEENGGER